MQADAGPGREEEEPWASIFCWSSWHHGPGKISVVVLLLRVGYCSLSTFGTKELAVSFVMTKASVVFSPRRCLFDKQHFSTVEKNLAYMWLW